MLILESLVEKKSVEKVRSQEMEIKKMLKKTVVANREPYGYTSQLIGPISLTSFWGQSTVSTCMMSPKKKIGRGIRVYKLNSLSVCVYRDGNV